MGRDDNTEDDYRGAPPGRAGEVASRVHEAIEALTALGLWLAAANVEVRKSPLPGTGRLREALARCTTQHRRASVAIRELRELARDDAGDHDAPGSRQRGPATDGAI